jgi:diguanylate cyclase (GGDEF)-like protein
MCLPVSFAEHLDLTEEELQWLEENDRVLSFGLDPFSGMDYFLFNGEEHGYVVDLVNLLEEELDIEIEIVSDQTWSDVYQGLIDHDIDILFGANVTEERLKFMSFTKPVHEYPYAVFVNKDSQVKTLGDMDRRNIGFLEGDIAIELFTHGFQNIHFNVIEYADQLEGLEALTNNEVDGFITSGGGIEYEFIYNYPLVNLMTQVEDITSEMTLATHKNQEVFASILNKVLDDHPEDIKSMVDSAQIIYNRKLLNLSDEELEWFTRDGVATVGIVEDYLPFDYYDNYKYYGIAGAIIGEISNVVGIEFEYVYGSFDEVYDMALKGEVDVLNMAKTTERLNHFIFPRSFREERDFIYGDKSEDAVNDIYGLEGKSVAVIKGFWHKEMLEKSLRDVTIVETESIQESLKLVGRGAVDYFIENPTVSEYYITGLGYFNIVKKGETSSDSFLYFGINKNEKELASIIDKSLLIIDYEELKQQGLSTVPKLVTSNVKTLIFIIVLLLIIITVGIYILVNAVKSLIRERESTAAFKEREHQMYLDPLTGLNNRLYFNYVEEQLNEHHFPQGIIMSDLNKLKQINDTLGHHMGDAYIRTYGNILRDHFKEHIICRMGGDEFLIIMKSSDESQVKLNLEQLAEKLIHTIIQYDNHDIQGIDVAIGYAIRLDNVRSLEEVMIVADNEMYLNKKQKKNYLNW